MFLLSWEKLHVKGVALLGLVLLAHGGCDSKPTQPAAQQAAKPSVANPSAAKAVEGVQVDAAKLALFQPLPEVMASESNPITEAKVSLGRMLFHETRLSVAGDISCNTCHLLDQFGAEPRRVSVGHEGQEGTRNSPSVYNAAGQIAQFWDGREPTVEAQAKGPILNPIEMAMPNEQAVIDRLAAIPEYVQQFQAAFPSDTPAMTYDNLAKAIGAFERKLVTPAPFDAFLKGDATALTDLQKRGLNTFLDVGCITCHMGPYLGGNLIHKLGLLKPWPDTTDQGRFEATGQDADRMMFKVPSLRNVAKTAPYFHDGREADLGEASRRMAEHQLGRNLDAQQIVAILAFFDALTGEIPTDYIQAPKAP